MEDDETSSLVQAESQTSETREGHEASTIGPPGFGGGVDEQVDNPGPGPDNYPLTNIYPLDQPPWLI